MILTHHDLILMAHAHRLVCFSTFMGIAIHEATTSDSTTEAATNLAAGVGQHASGLLGTTAQIADMVRWTPDEREVTHRYLLHLYRSFRLLLVASSILGP